MTIISKRSLEYNSSLKKNTFFIKKKILLISGSIIGNLLTPSKAKDEKIKNSQKGENNIIGNNNQITTIFLDEAITKKKETSDYISKLTSRLGRILKDTNYQISEISEMLNYNSVTVVENYFKGIEEPDVAFLENLAKSAVIYAA